MEHKGMKHMKEKEMEASHEKMGGKKEYGKMKGKGKKLGIEAKPC